MFCNNAVDSEFQFVGEDGKVVPACGVGVFVKEGIARIKGPCPDRDEDGNIHVGHVYSDGINAEFNVVPVACHGFTLDYAMACYHGAKYVARKLGYTAEFKSFTPTNMVNLKDCGPEAFQSGCNPRRNAFKKEVSRFNKPYEKIVKEDGVFAGYHIHLDTPRCVNRRLDRIAIQMTKRVLPAILLFASDEDRECMFQRLDITQCGHYRKKSYGIEYMDLGAEVATSPWLILTAFELAREIITANEVSMKSIGRFSYPSEIREVEENRERAFEFLKAIDKTSNIEIWESIRNKDMVALRQIFDRQIFSEVSYSAAGHGRVSNGQQFEKRFFRLMDDKSWRGLRLFEGLICNHSERFGYQTLSADLCRVLDKYPYGADERSWANRISNGER